MKTVLEALQRIRYKLHILGIPIDGATHIYGYSISLINNTSKPKSALKKKNKTVCYHAVHEPVTMGESLHLQLMKI